LKLKIIISGILLKIWIPIIKLRRTRQLNIIAQAYGRFSKTLGIIKLTTYHPAS
jgi:hypothetical protein